MAKFNFFSHDFTGEDPSARAKRQGYICRKDYGTYYTLGIAENIFQGWLYSSTTYFWMSIPVKNWMSVDDIAREAVEGWMNSPGHRSNILNRAYDREGIGVAISSDEKVLITQDFC